MIKADKELFAMIKGLIVSSGKSRTDLADYLGIKYQSLANKIQRGSLSATELIELCNFLDCSITITKPDGDTITLNKYARKGNEEHEHN